MHELSIAESLLDIIKQEMAKYNVTKLHKVVVIHGQMTALVPEALEMAFQALTITTPLEGAEMETRQIPLKVKCRECGFVFTPEGDDKYLMPCPECGEELGHEIIQGRELYIENIEAE